MLVALWIGVLVMMAALGAAVGSAMATRTALASAADLGALAGASAALEGGDRACALAGRVVTANDASLTSCRLEAAEIWVEVTRPIPPGLTWIVPGTSGRRMHARAHAELVAGEP